MPGAEPPGGEVLRGPGRQASIRPDGRMTCPTWGVKTVPNLCQYSEM